MKKHVAFVLSAGLMTALASPALAMGCSGYGHTASKEQTVAEAPQTKTEEAISTFDPKVLEEAQPTVEKPVEEKGE